MNTRAPYTRPLLTVALSLVLAALAGEAAFAQTSDGSSPQSAPRFLRFVVMGDPQYHVPSAGGPGGYQWSSQVWREMPRVMSALKAKYLFVCGDVFEYRQGDGSNVRDLWDEWDRYLGEFDPSVRVEWIAGGHEWWGGNRTDDAQALSYFKSRHPGHVRYEIKDDEDRFILFDDTHSPGELGPGGLAWLDQTLAANRDAKRTWFFGHVPPRSSATWWPSGLDALAPAADPFRSRMASTLQTYGVRAAFFGHEHQEAYLGNRGTFDMFVAGQRWPLLVEVNGDRVRYQWIIDPAAANPMAQGLPILLSRAVPSFQALVWPRSEPLPDLSTVDGSPMPTSRGESLPFRTVGGWNGRIDLTSLRGVRDGDRVIVVADYTLAGGWPARCALVQSDMRYSLWLNGRFEDASPATDGRLHSYQMSKDASGVNRAVLLLTIAGDRRRFSFFPHSFPPVLAQEPRR